LTPFVLDASVALAWFLDNPVPAYAQRVRASLLAGATAIVPALWQLEMANGFVVSERRGILKAADADLALLQIGQLRAQAIDVSAEAVSLTEAFSVARKFRLSAYDAVYLETARRLTLPIATLARSLVSAAKSAKVDIFR
jgi:predicted nucleic acid-binding protein